MIVKTLMVSIRRRIGKDYPAVYKDEVINVELEIDEISLAHSLGNKAVNNKSNKSHIAGGYVKAKIVANK